MKAAVFGGGTVATASGISSTTIPRRPLCGYDFRRLLAWLRLLLLRILIGLGLAVQLKLA
jgi:hypothetical protein